MSVNHPFFYKGLYITLISALCFYFPTQGLAEPVSTLPDLAEPPPLWHTPSPETEFDKQLKAAAQGDAAAQYNLGVMYAEGEGVAKDTVKAVEWYKKAAAQGDKDALQRLKVLKKRK